MQSFLFTDAPVVCCLNVGRRDLEIAVFRWCESGGWGGEICGRATGSGRGRVANVGASARWLSGEIPTAVDRRASSYVIAAAHLEGLSFKFSPAHAHFLQGFPASGRPQQPKQPLKPAWTLVISRPPVQVSPPPPPSQSGSPRPLPANSSAHPPRMSIPLLNEQKVAPTHGTTSLSSPLRRTRTPVPHHSAARAACRSAEDRFAAHSRGTTSIPMASMAERRTRACGGRGARRVLLFAGTRSCWACALGMKCAVGLVEI